MRTALRHIGDGIEMGGSRRGIARVPGGGALALIPCAIVLPGTG